MYGLLKGKKELFSVHLMTNLSLESSRTLPRRRCRIYPFKRSYRYENGRNKRFSRKNGFRSNWRRRHFYRRSRKSFDVAIAKFGKIDFILHSIGMSVNVRKGKHYTDINYDWLEKGWDVSAVSFHKVMKTAWEKDCMNEWGSILALPTLLHSVLSQIIMIWQTINLT